MFCGSIRLDAYSPDVRRQIHRHFERRVRSLPQYVIKGGLVVVSGGCNGVWRLVAAGGSPRRYLRHQAAETQRRSICASCSGVSHSQPEGGSPERPVVGSFPSPNCGLIPMGLLGSMHVKLWRTGMQGHTPINGFPPVARIGDVATLPTSPLVANDRVALPLHPRVEALDPWSPAPVSGFLLTLPKIDQRLDWTADKSQRSRRLGQRRFRMAQPLE